MELCRWNSGLTFMRKSSWKNDVINTGKDEKWLLHQIKGQGADHVEDVLLATCDSENKVTVFLKDNHKEMKDVLI